MQTKNEFTTLNSLKPKDHCIITKLSDTDRLGQRLLDLGIYPGLSVQILRNAPLEDPMEIEINGYFISLRHEEAQAVEVKKQVEETK